MKKNLLFGIALLTITLCFTGCPNPNGGNGDGTKTVTIKNADVLFIANPTNNQQKNNENWIKVNVSPDVRAAAEAIALKEQSARSGTTAEGKTFYEMGDRHLFRGTEGFIDPNNNACEGSVSFIGKHCYLWTLVKEAKGKDESLKFTYDELKVIADKFDILYEKETALIGLPYQGNSKFEGIINPCDKVSILLCDMGKDGYGKWGGVFMSNTYYKNENGEDQIELITIDSCYLKSDMNSVFTTVAHEFNHLLNFVNKYLVKGRLYARWYTEMLSMLVEDYCIDDYDIDVTSSVQLRIPTFANGSYNYGFGGENWRNEDPYVNLKYANAYAFGAYLVRNYGGAELIHEIATNDYVDEESIEKAVYKVTGKKYSFAELFNNFPKVLINPKNEISDLPSLFKSCENTITVDGKEFTYKFYAIDFDTFATESNPKIVKPKNLELLKIDTLNSYGFWFFAFDKKTDMTITLEDFLCYDSYSF